MMEDCERVLEVEDMILGHATAPDLCWHLLTCRACKEAEAMFREEHALFVARRTPAKRRAPVQVKRWATLAIAASLALAGSALRSEVTRAEPTVLACSMPERGETLACTMKEPVTSSVATP